MKMLYTEVYYFEWILSYYFKFILVLVFILIFSLPINAQLSLIKFRHLSIENGLSESSILSILQDSYGFMWFGTEDGLNRFDGYNFVVKKYDPSDSNSISNNKILSMYEDRNKNIWIGTEGGGLNVYDQVHDRFVRYKNDKDNHNSISNNNVWSICEDKDGFLWIGTINGLNKFDTEKKTFKRYYNETNNSNSLTDNAVLSLYCDHNGQLWIGTNNGLNIYDSKTNSFKRYFHSKEDQNSISNNSVLCFTEDNKNHLWIGTFNGLNRYDYDTGKFNLFKNKNLKINDIRSICFDGKESIWFGTKGGGLNKLNINTNEFINYSQIKNNPLSLNNDEVFSVYCDRAGAVWAGTMGGGLNIFDKNAQKFRHYKSFTNQKGELSSNDILSIYKENDSIIWVGTRDNGLNKYNRNTGLSKNYIYDKNNSYSISSSSVFSIAGNNNVLWIGTRDGLNKFDKSTNKFKRFYYLKDDAGKNEEGIIKIYKDKKGIFWLGSRGKGVYLFNPKSEKFLKHIFKKVKGNGFSDNFVYSILEDSKGIYWFGTNNGLNKYDPVTNKFITYLPEEGNMNSISSNVIWTIYEDKNSNLWLGTRNGLDFYNRGKNIFKSYTEKDGLANDVIYGILNDEEGNLWLSSNNGIIEASRQPSPPKGVLRTKKRAFSKAPSLREGVGDGLFFNFTSSDGIQSPEFNFEAYYKSNDGEMFFGGINGFNSFYPKDIKTNKYIPPVYITNLKLLNRDVNVKNNSSENSILDSSIFVKKEITLSYKENIFSLEFASLNYFAPYKNRYEYKLKGFNNEWKPVSAKQRSVTYTNLDPGKYVFEVKASNNDDLWNPVPAKIEINITPPFWQTVWFRISSILLIAGMIFLFFQSRIKKVNEEKIKQENFSKQLIESQENERKRIAGEMHDSLGQSLLIIKNRAVLGLQNSNNEKDIEEHFSEISSIASDTLKEVRQISHDLRPYQLDRLGLTDTIKGTVKKISESSKINFELNCDDVDNLFDKDKEINIYRIIQETINNIVKHSKASNALIEIKKQNSEVAIKISDDGIGLAPNHSNKKDGLSGLGLTGIEERVKILKGKMSINSSQGNGVHLFITLPIDTKFRNS